jgi:hypothetical protein
MKKIILVLYFGIILLFTGCPDKGPVKIDPCAGLHPVKADFDIYEQLSYDSLFISDTALKGNVVWFIAKGNYQNYKWKIGTDDSLFIGDTICLRFNEPYNKITVTLFVSSPPDTTCFPGDDGKDTLTKYLTIMPWDKCALIGDYKGFNLDNPSDTFIVNIRYQDIFDNGNKVGHMYYVNNINKGCTEPFSDHGTSNNYLIGYKHIQIRGGANHTGGCMAPWGYANLDNLQEYITIDYRSDIDQSGLKYQNHIYIGKKIWN